MTGREYINIAYKKLETIKDTPEKEIYLVKKLSTNQLYILKIINRVNLSAKSLLGVHHPNLATIHELTEDNGTTYIITEYISGITLTEYLEHNPSLDFDHLKSILLSLCSAIECLHNHGVIHRDIKPDNIFMTSDNIIKLLDYDAARKKTAPKIQDTVCLGTQGYASPEQYGFQSTDERSDIYSLGVTMKFILKDKYTPAMKAIIDKCTQFDPANRYQNISDLMNDLLLCQNNNFLPVLDTWKYAYLLHKLLIFSAVSMIFWMIAGRAIPADTYVNMRFFNLFLYVVSYLIYCVYLNKKCTLTKLQKVPPKFNTIKKILLAIPYYIAWQYTLGSVAVLCGMAVYQGYWDKVILGSTMVLAPILTAVSVAVKNRIKKS